MRPPGSSQGKLGNSAHLVPERGVKRQEKVKIALSLNFKMQEAAAGKGQAKCRRSLEASLKTESHRTAQILAKTKRSYPTAGLKKSGRGVAPRDVHTMLALWCGRRGAGTSDDTRGTHASPRQLLVPCWHRATGGKI